MQLSAEPESPAHPKQPCHRWAVPGYVLPELHLPRAQEELMARHSVFPLAENAVMLRRVYSFLDSPAVSGRDGFFLKRLFIVHGAQQAEQGTQQALVVLCRNCTAV